MTKIILTVPDISCEHCQRAIEGALGKEAGVAAVRVDVPTKQVFLDYDPSTISLDQVSAILDDEGYAVTGQTPQSGS
jgi:copper chaperone CopZ